MRSSFTLLELIFVIVILGILAAVAVPKMMTTRTDANTVKVISDIKNATNIVDTFYTSQGGEVNFSKLKTNNYLIKKLEGEGWLKIKNDTTAYIYSDPALKKVCFTYTTDGKQIQVETNTTNNDNMCNNFKKFISDHNISILNQVVKF